MKVRVSARSPDEKLLAAAKAEDLNFLPSRWQNVAERTRDYFKSKPRLPDQKSIWEFWKASLINPLNTTKAA
jgi:hypothetical protein